MFGSIAHLIPAAAPAGGPPKEIPPPTPVNLPRCYPQIRDPSAPAPATDPGPGRQAPNTGRPPKPITALLQGVIRPADVSIGHLEALGVHVTPDVALAELIPEPALIPDFDAWHALSTEEVHAVNESTRRRLNTGNLSPGCQAYLDRRRELSISNEAAYRTIRRLPAPKGQSQARLGNAYEFYRHLELFSSYWLDTSNPSPPAASAGGSQTENDDPKANQEGSETARTYRTSSGSQMPPDYRQSMLTAFLKLVTYDFGCNITAPRTEPKLQITSPGVGSQLPRSSAFSSGCTFIFRSPTTREAARAGIVEGPVAAVSARHNVSFPSPGPSSGDAVAQPDRESTLDLARELVAALITAQHRRREGRTEKRVGQDAWWATKPRWGGGPGGPIGREIEMQSGADETIGDKDEPPPLRGTADSPSSAAAAPRRLIASPRPPPFGTLPSLSPGSSSSSSKGVKRLKKSGNLPMYDNYRMVRPPASTWDRKTKYAAIGRARGVDYDDIFVVSCLFHHISVVRVRVPDRLLDVLEGSCAGNQIEGTEGEKKSSSSWGGLEVKRSPWLDFFRIEDRIRAMQMMWAVMAWMMREVPADTAEPNNGAEIGKRGETKVGGDGDVSMRDA